MDMPIKPVALSRSLTIVGSPSRNSETAKDTKGHSSHRASSGFIAQLLAARHAAAAYRQRRKCTPEEARHAYLAVSNLQAPETSRINIAA